MTKTHNFLSKISLFLILANFVAFTCSSTEEQFSKTINKVFIPTIASEGAGAKVRRIIGSQQLPRLDPFLMLDNFVTRLPGGFPDHPHRGFETVTYMLSGSIHHEDFKGNKGLLHAGDLQWMTAGKGILHSEMPGSFDEDSVGFQLWLNLAAKDKFCEPEYQEIKKEKIPVVNKEGVIVKVIAGESLGGIGPIVAKTPALFIDVEMQPNQKFEQVIPKGWNSFSYVYEGESYYGFWQQKVGQYSVAVFNNEDKEILKVETKDKPAKFIIIGGLPMNEPIFTYGPFVMSSSAELEQTFTDFHMGKNGFEGAPGWKSKIKDLSQKK